LLGWRARTGEETLDGFLDTEGKVERDCAVNGNFSGNVVEQGWVSADRRRIARGEDIDTDAVRREVSSNTLTPPTGGNV